MAAVYDNWERLVTATLRREELRRSALRTPSDLSSVSTESPSPSFNFSSNYGRASSLLVGDSFTFVQILRATDCLNDSNLIKHGHSGDLYFGVLESGIEVVVKKLNVSSFDEESCCISEMEICGMVCHSRLIPLLGYCLDNANEKFLVYKYMPNKDLSRFLNGENDRDRQSMSLNWTTRLKIATGAIEGLYHLHHECFPPLVHRDIQASSILLDDKFEAQLGSLAGVCIEEKDTNKYRIPRFLRSPKGFEQSSSGASTATCAYDVYCFGKVLLELVTGKLGTPSGNDSTRKNWLAGTLRHIVPDDKKLIVNIVDSSLILDELLLAEAWAVAFVAKVCLSRNPSKRPQTAEILMALGNLARLTGRELPTGYLSSVASAPGIKPVPDRLGRIGLTTLTIKPDDISGGSTASRLKFDKMRIRRLLEYSVMELQRYSFVDIKRITNGFKDPLRKGVFGSVFKGKVSNEIYVCVKLLNNSTIGAETFINEVATVRMIHHVNIACLLGFCADGFEIALVYEFLPHGSLDKFIFQEGQEHHTLGMERLQNIAIGIARGIEYLHQGCEQRIIHFDIKPENILLDDNYNPKICDFGLAKVCGKDIDAVSLISRRGTLGYIAPELIYRNLGDVSYKSDIYSFGMLLLEMVGRRRSFDISVQDESELHFPAWAYGRLINGERLRTEVEEDGEDKILKKLAIVGLWCIELNPDDRPSMTLVLQMLEGSGENLRLLPFQSNLKLGVKGKLKYFIWKCWYGTLPTKDQLLKRGIFKDPICNMCGEDKETLERIFKDPICNMCGEDKETLEHVLFYCPRAQKVWKLAPVKWDALGRESLSFKQWWYEVCNGTKDNYLHDRMELTIYILWMLWKTRNRWIFQQEWREERVVVDLAIEKWLKFQEMCRLERESS